MEGFPCLPIGGSGFTLAMLLQWVVVQGLINFFFVKVIIDNCSIWIACYIKSVSVAPDEVDNVQETRRTLQTTTCG